VSEKNLQKQSKINSRQNHSDYCANVNKANSLCWYGIIDPATLFSQNDFVISGGLADEATAETVRSAFITFGDIVDVNMPIDNRTGKWIWKDIKPEN
jgi:hypothetical protein